MKNILFTSISILATSFLLSGCSKEVKINNVSTYHYDENKSEIKNVKVSSIKMLNGVLKIQTNGTHFIPEYKKDFKIVKSSDCSKKVYSKVFNSEIPSCETVFNQVEIGTNFTEKYKKLDNTPVSNIPFEVKYTISFADADGSIVTKDFIKNIRTDANGFTSLDLNNLIFILFPNATLFNATITSVDIPEKVFEVKIDKADLIILKEMFETKHFHKIN